jgi:5'-phosphate synthase pdxT subunit
VKGPIGLLALQGDFEMHRQALARAGVETRPVRRRAELEDCAGLVIPGGESTTLSRLIDRGGLREPLREFARQRPILGTCAGLIILARRLEDEAPEHGVRPLELLDCEVRRNGYGRQVDSFQADVSLAGLAAHGPARSEKGGTAPAGPASAPFRGVFIRAPRIVEVGPGVEVVAALGDEPVGVSQGHVLAFTFHPELTPDPRLHEVFARMAGRD